MINSKYKGDYYTVYQFRIGMNMVGARHVKNGEPVPKCYFLTEQEALQSHKDRLKRNAEAYKANQSKADLILDKVEKELKEVLKNHGASLSFDYDNDSQGMYGERITISVNVENRIYEREFEA